MRQEDIKQAVLNAALKKGANMVQVMAAQSGQGLKEAAAQLDKAGGVGSPAAAKPADQEKKPAKQRPLTSKEQQDMVGRCEGVVRTGRE